MKRTSFAAQYSLYEGLLFTVEISLISLMLTFLSNPNLSSPPGSLKKLVIATLTFTLASSTRCHDGDKTQSYDMLYHIRYTTEMNT